MTETCLETVDAVLAEYEDEPDRGYDERKSSIEPAGNNRVSSVRGITAAAVGAGILLGGCAQTSSEQPQFETSPGEEERYAVVIGGADNAEPDGSNPDQYVLDHENNIALAYRTLIQQGFDEDNVYVLFHGGEQHDDFPVSGPATNHFIAKTFDALDDKIDSNDFLFVHYTGHGNRLDSNGEVDHSKEEGEDYSYVLNVPGEDVPVAAFEEYITGTSPGTGVMLFNNCFSGKFADRIAEHDGFVALSHDDEYAVGTDFSPPFFNGWRDGMTDLEELFDRAYEGGRSVPQGEISKWNRPWDEPKLYSGDDDPEKIDMPTGE